MSATLTREQRVAALPPEDQQRLHALLKDRKHGSQWREQARPTQLPPWDWASNRWHMYTDTNGVRMPYRIGYLQGGRGAGKTWAGANAFVEAVLWHGGYDTAGNPREWLIVGPTHDQAWSVCVAGPSGILARLGRDRVKSMNRQNGEVHLHSGAVIYVTGADTGAPRAQGKNLSGVWCDEVGMWRPRQWRTAWIESIRPALRIGPAVAIMTGTPKQGHPLVEWLRKSIRCRVVVTRTRDNEANLDAEALADLEAELGGTRLGRQELDGEFLTDVPGALWTLAMIDEHRVDTVDPNDIREIVIGWDPAMKTSGDEHGIQVVGRGYGTHPHLYEFEDLSGHYTPDEACRVVAAAAERWGATCAVVETNNGGNWIPALVAQVTPHLIVKAVTATVGKARRADRLVAVSEQGRLHFVGDQYSDTVTGATKFARLIEQMTRWVEGSPDSPDRMDGLVWAGIYHLNAANPAPAATSGWAIATTAD